MFTTVMLVLVGIGLWLAVKGGLARRLPMAVGALLWILARTGELVRRAGEAFDRYLEALGDRRFQEASGALQRLEAALENLSDLLAAEPADETGGAEPAPR